MNEKEIVEFPDFPEVRVLIFPEGGMYIAQCLEVDVAAQGRSLEECTTRLKYALVGQLEMDRREGNPRGVASPRRFFEGYAGATEVQVPIRWHNSAKVEVRLPIFRVRFK